MSATHIQCGIVNHRVNREPLDVDSVLAYDDLINGITRDIAVGSTKSGALYAGMITAVVEDPESAYSAYNGPYYISYSNGNESLSYNATRLVLSNDIDDVEEDVSKTLFGWGVLE